MPHLVDRLVIREHMRAAGTSLLERGSAWSGVTPFCGLRYNADVIGDWGAALGPPYDILDATEAERLKAANPYQIAHVESASGEAGDRRGGAATPELARVRGLGARRAARHFICMNTASAPGRFAERCSAWSNSRPGTKAA